MNLKKMISMALVLTMLASQSVFAINTTKTDTEISKQTKEDSTFNVTNGVELVDIEFIHNGTYKERKLIKLKDSPSDSSQVAGTDSFIGDVADYDLYLISTDSKEITLNAIADRRGINDTLKINGTTVGRDTTNPKVTNQFESTTITVANGDVVTIELTRGTDVTTYTITVKIPDSIQADPHIYGELTPRVSEITSLVSVYGVNADVINATITFDLTYVGEADTAAFKGFSKTDGTLFDNISDEFNKDTDTYFELDKDFVIRTLKSNGEFLSITIEPKVGTVVSIGAEPRKILTVSLLNNKDYTGTATEMVNTITVRPAKDVDATNLGNFGSAAYLDGYLEVKDTKADNSEDDRATLSYIKNVDIEHTIYMRINHDSNNRRVTYEMMTDVNTTLKGSLGYVINRDVEYKMIGTGTYKMRISAKGYKILTTADIELDGKPDEFGISFRTIKLLEGDLDGDNAIGTSDRSKLATTINQKVINSGDGFIKVGNEDIYSDYNDDDFVNALDLGRLIKNTALDYGTNISPRT